MRFGYKVLALLVSTAASGCTQMPVDGPDRRAIELGASASAGNAKRSAVVRYAPVDTPAPVVEHAAYVAPDSLFKTFGQRPGPAPLIRVGEGDVVQVTIFESSAGGLFIPAEAGVRPGNFVTLPNQIVDRGGQI